MVSYGSTCFMWETGCVVWGTLGWPDTNNQAVIAHPGLVSWLRVTSHQAADLLVVRVFVVIPMEKHIAKGTRHRK